MLTHRGLAVLFLGFLDAALAALDTEHRRKYDQCSFLGQGMNRYNKKRILDCSGIGIAVTGTTYIKQQEP
jgi:hypothetical protein